MMHVTAVRACCKVSLASVRNTVRPRPEFPADEGGWGGAPAMAGERLVSCSTMSKKRLRVAMVEAAVRRCLLNAEMTIGMPMYSATSACARICSRRTATWAPPPPPPHGRRRQLARPP